MADAALDPGMALVPDSVDAEHWSRELDLPFYGAAIGTNGHNIALVLSDLTVDTVHVGHTPFVIPSGGLDFKIPLL